MDLTRLPGYWWGGPEGADRAPELSIVDLIRGGNLDARIAALFWLFLERRASVIVAAGPRLAGKTTTLTALLSFLPSETRLVFTKGSYETFDFLRSGEPARSYILINEMSNHTPYYLWDAGLVRVFQATQAGYAFGGTMHAETVQEVVQSLATLPQAIPVSQLKGITLMVFLQAHGTPEGMRRRVWEVLFLWPDAPVDAQLVFTRLAHWDPEAGAFATTQDPETLAAAARWLGMDREAFSLEWARREAYLQAVVERGSASVADVAQTVQDYSAQKLSGGTS